MLQKLWLVNLRGVWPPYQTPEMARVPYDEGLWKPLVSLISAGASLGRGHISRFTSGWLAHKKTEKHRASTTQCYEFHWCKQIIQNSEPWESKPFPRVVFWGFQSLFQYLRVQSWRFLGERLHFFGGAKLTRHVAMFMFRISTIGILKARRGWSLFFFAGIRVVVSRLGESCFSRNFLQPLGCYKSKPFWGGCIHFCLYYIRY